MFGCLVYDQLKIHSVVLNYLLDQQQESYSIIYMLNDGIKIKLIFNEINMILTNF